MGMICMNTKSHHKLLLYLLWSLLELWHGLGIVVLQESIVVFAVKIKKGDKCRVRSRNLATTIFVSIDDQNLPLGHVFGRIAGLCVLVVHQAQLAALFTWGNSVQADVEFGTVRGISVFRMRIRKAKDFSLGFELGALETVLRYLMFCRGSRQ